MCGLRPAPGNPSSLREKHFAKKVDAQVKPALDGADVATLICGPVQPAFKKYFAFSFGRNSNRAVPSRTAERAYRDRHETWSGMRWTLTVLQDERCCRGRQSRVVLAPRRWRKVRGRIHERRGQESPVPGKRTKETVKTNARGMPAEAAYLW
jgi:hypothetical protein